MQFSGSLSSVQLSLELRQTKEVTYKTLVRPQLKHATPILASLSQDSVSAGSEVAVNSCQVDMQAMEEYKLCRRYVRRT